MTCPRGPATDGSSEFAHIVRALTSRSVKYDVPNGNRTVSFGCGCDGPVDTSKLANSASAVRLSIVILRMPLVTVSDDHAGAARKSKKAAKAANAAVRKRMNVT